nr:MAG TPA: transforming protein [Caudoviricetes sp.]
MGGRGASSSIKQSHTGAVLTGSSTVASNLTYGSFDDNDAKKLRDDMEDKYDPDVTDAIKLYISNSNPNGDGYSHSQNLNYKLENGIALNPTEKFIDENIQSGMHAIGKNSELVRYCHDDVLKSVGIADYTKMSGAQLQSALVGKTITTTSYMSTSYDSNKNPFNPSAPGGGGREVVMKIKAGKDTKMVFGAKAQAEIVINKGTNFRITDVKYDGSYATPRRSGRKPRIELEIETY